MSILPYAGVIGKWELNHAESLDMADRLRNAATHHPNPTALIRRADRMATCATRLEYQYCPECGNLHLARTNLCRDRLCPTCAWRLSLQRTGEMMHTLQYLHENEIAYTGAMLTLTIRNCTIEALDSTIDRLLYAWGLLLKRRKVARYIRGTCRSVEITRGTNGTLHPHIHALVFFEPTYTANIAQREWADLWRESLDVDYTPIVDIRRTYSRGASDDAWASLVSATVEATKYITKPDVMRSLDPAEIARVAMAIQGRRMVGYTGIIREARAALRYNNHDTVTDVDAITIECPKCGCTSMVALSYEWSVSAGYELAPFLGAGRD